MTKEEARQVIKSRVETCPISEQEKAGILFCQQVYELVEQEPIRSLASVLEKDKEDGEKGGRQKKAKEFKKTCTVCGKEYTTGSPAARYCKECADERKKEARRRWQEKQKESLADEVASIEEMASELAAMDMEQGI